MTQSALTEQPAHILLPFSLFSFFLLFPFQASPLEMYKTVSAWKRQPMRVLSLFGNIDKGECSHIK